MSLLSRRLVVVTGKGGVGKSTVAAAMALAAAARGRRVLVCEVNSDGRVPALLGAPSPGPEIRRVAPGVEAVVVRPREAMHEYLLLQLKVRRVVDALLENRLVTRFLRFIPSLSELVMLGKVLFHVREDRWDLVILDAPATGHGITFLRVPAAIGDTVPPGPMRREARWMQGLLEDGKDTAVALVALPEELVVAETLELARSLREDVRMTIPVAFLNRQMDPAFSGEERASLGAAGGDPLIEAAIAAAIAHDGRAIRGAAQAARLDRELGARIFPIPQLFPVGDFDRSCIERVAAAVAPALEGG